MTGAEKPPHEKPVSLAARMIVREEGDGYAILVDPDGPRSWILNPVSLLVCRRLDGTRRVPELADVARAAFRDVPDDVEDDVRDFVGRLVEAGLAEPAGS